MQQRSAKIGGGASRFLRRIAARTLGNGREGGETYPEAGESFSRPIDTLARRKDTHRSRAGWRERFSRVRHTPCTTTMPRRFAMNWRTEAAAGLAAHSEGDGLERPDE